MANFQFSCFALSNHIFQNIHRSESHDCPFEKDYVDLKQQSLEPCTWLFLSFVKLGAELIFQGKLLIELNYLMISGGVWIFISDFVPPFPRLLSSQRRFSSRDKLRKGFFFLFIPTLFWVNVGKSHLICTKQNKVISLFISRCVCGIHWQRLT